MDSGIQTQVIEIPAGSAFVRAADIPNWIAERLVPIPDAAPVLCDLVKRTQVEVGHWRDDELTQADWDWLAEIWRDMPPVGDSNPETFEAYTRAFDAAPDKPNWRLHAQFKHPKQEANKERMNVRNRHFWELDAAIKSGAMKALAAHRVPASKLSHDCIVSFDDARHYLQQRGFELREVSPAQREQSTAGALARKTEAKPFVDAIPLAGAARALAIMEVGEDKDDGLISIVEVKWQHVINHLLKQSKLPLLARYDDGEKPSFEPTTELQNAWVANDELCRIFAGAPREAIEEFERERRQEADARARNETDRRAVGRYIVSEAARELSEKTGWKIERWVKTIIDAILTNELPARNPQNFTDALPYTPSKITGYDYQIRDYSEQVSKDDVNKWLAAHREWGENLCLGDAPVASRVSVECLEHFSISEAAAELDMTEAAVLRECLDEHLELSIRFSGRNLPYAKLRRQVPLEPGYPPARVKTAELGLYDGTKTLGTDRSLWTLVMAGSGRLCVEDEYQKAIGRTPAVSESSPSSRLGVFVSAPDVSMQEPDYVMLYELVEYRGTAPADAIRYDEDFHSMHVLPTGAELVVSKEALRTFQEKRTSDVQWRPAGSAAQTYRANEQPSIFDLSLVGKMSADWQAMSADERERTRNNIAFTRQSMQQAEQDRASRYAAGRYTLLEAAGFIARATHTNTDTVLGEMHREAESHGLPVYMPGASNACTWPNEDYGDLCHVLVSDLNRFIDKYHPGDFHFPEPTTRAPAFQDKRSAADTEKPKHANANPPAATLQPSDSKQSSRLTLSPNSLSSIQAHIVRRAREIFNAGQATKMGAIAEIIANELKDMGHRGERGKYLSAARVARLLPAGLTGGRAKNGGKK
jgi:hypothetical protein